MCGRFALDATAAQLAELFALAELDDFPSRFNIAPTQPVLAILNGPARDIGSNLPQRIALLVRWGLIPGWTKDPRALPLLFNARSETAAEKASFKAAFRHRRALIPATGFYEWRRDGGGKRSQPFYVKPRRGGVIAFAGLVETYLEPGGSEIDTGAILTIRATGEIAQIHDRMPVVIREEDFARWLDCTTREPRDVADLLEPVEPDFFEAVPVSDKVNKVDNMGPEVQAPVAGTAPRSVEERPAPRQMELF